MNTLLRTEHLLLKRLVRADAEAVQRLAGDTAVAYNALHIPHPLHNGTAEAWIDSLAANETVFALRRYPAEPLIGLVGLAVDTTGIKAELSYWIGQPFWGKGYATEAARAMLTYGFNLLRLERVYATTLTRNQVACRVLEKIGLCHEGHLRHDALHWGQYEDVEMYGIVKQDFEQIRIRAQRNATPSRIPFAQRVIQRVQLSA